MWPVARRAPTRAVRPQLQPSIDGEFVAVAVASAVVSATASCEWTWCCCSNAYRCADVASVEIDSVVVDDAGVVVGAATYLLRAQLQLLLLLLLLLLQLPLSMFLRL